MLLEVNEMLLVNFTLDWPTDNNVTILPAKLKECDQLSQQNVTDHSLIGRFGPC